MGIMSGVTAGLQALKSALGLAEKQQEYAHDEAEQDVGAMGQREADQKATLEAKDDQLEKAARHKRGDAAKRLRDRSF